jgi:hypothetical protein
MRDVPDTSELVGTKKLASLIMKQCCLALIAFLSTLPLCFCSSAERNEKPVPSVAEPKQETESQQMSIVDLKRLYRSARSEFERRTLCLQAIDGGAVYKGGPISSLDEVFGTNFGSQLPTQTEVRRVGVVHFVLENASEPSSEPSSVARGYSGWYLAVGYDHNGRIQDYYLTNLHKGMSSIEETNDKLPIAELKRLYESSQSYQERRALCLKAIETGAIVTTGSISSVDEIFGTAFASNLPSRKQVEKTGRVPFALQDSSAASSAESSTAKTGNGWVLVVQYDYNGDIQNYYLTNIQT